MGVEIELPGVREPVSSLREDVRRAVIWRSGSQIAAQLVQWIATFMVIRLLDPADYGLFAMTQGVIALLTLLNGYSFASALVQAPAIDALRTRQVFGMLILLNGVIAALQVAVAPLVAGYFRHPIVADLLRAQALLYLATPFIALPNALLSRAMDFRRQAQVNLASALVAASTALGGALAGWGVWTLVAAPIAMYWTRAIGMTLAARLLIRPSFRFAGAGAAFGFGGALVVSGFFWFVQTQADVLIAGRSLGAHEIGLYTTSLFLSQILVAKFVPALNEVAFPAYASIQDDRAAMARNFAKSVRIVMLVAMPFSLGLAATAEPLVLTVLGGKWGEAAPIVRMLALAMPFVTLYALYTPAINAVGRPGLTALIAMLGALVMPAAFAIGVRHGAVGLAGAWLFAAPALLVAASALSLPAIGVRAGEVAAAVRPAALAAIVMAVAVVGLDRLLPVLAAPLHLVTLVAAGGSVYAAALLLTARGAVEELVELIAARRRT